MENKIRQELYCHGCNQYVQFDIDVSLSGNHTIVCPKCGHDHYRVVRNGKVTDIRWNDGIPVSSTTNYIATNLSTSTASSYDSYNGTTAGSSNYLIYQSWMNTTGTGS